MKNLINRALAAEKKLLLILVAAVMAVNMMAEETKPLVFNETSINLGTIKEDGGRVSCTFHFRNVTNETITITGVRLTTGAMMARYSKKMIAPKDTGSVTVTVNPRGRDGRFTKPVVITYADRENSYNVTLRLIAQISQALDKKYPFKAGALNLRKETIENYRIMGGTYYENIAFANITDQPLDVEIRFEDVNTKQKSVVYHKQLASNEEGDVNFEFNYSEDVTVGGVVTIMVNNQQVKELIIYSIYWNKVNEKGRELWVATWGYGPAYNDY